jgi:hypothetical protein
MRRQLYKFVTHLQCGRSSSSSSSREFPNWLVNYTLKMSCGDVRTVVYIYLLFAMVTRLVDWRVVIAILKLLHSLQQPYEYFDECIYIQYGLLPVVGLSLLVA